MTVIKMVIAMVMMMTMMMTIMMVTAMKKMTMIMMLVMFRGNCRLRKRTIAPEELPTEKTGAGRNSPGAGSAYCRGGSVSA